MFWKQIETVLFSNVSNLSFGFIATTSVQWRSPRIWGGKMFWGAKCMILGEYPYFFGKTPFKAQNGYIFQIFGGRHGLFGPLGYAYTSVVPLVSH